jgi:hypothetical protein
LKTQRIFFQTNGFQSLIVLNGYNEPLLSGKIFRFLASLGVTGFLSVHGLRGFVGGFATNKTPQRLKLLNVISNEARNPNLNKFTRH